MEILSVYSKEFAPYGKVLAGYDTKDLTEELAKITPPEGVEYVMSEPALEKLNVTHDLCENAFGGLDIECGWCGGHNTKLNCLEYHKSSEINIGAYDYILLLALMTDIENGRLDTSKVKAFKAYAGDVVEVYSTTLHYAPCSAKSGSGFMTAIILPKGTNAKLDAKVYRQDKTLFAVNKWLLAHPESDEAFHGAEALLDGENIDINALI